MTTVEAIDSLAQWLRDEVCSTMRLKVPDNTNQTDGYEYKLANPTVFEMFAPPSRLVQMQNQELCPGILVHLTEGEDKPRDPSRILKFRLLLCVWNPGHHPEDGGVDIFEPNADGWRDLWGFVDAVLMKLKNAEIIDNSLRVMAENGFHYEPYKEDEAIIDFYPFFFATLEFSAEPVLVPSTRYIEEYL